MKEIHQVKVFSEFTPFLLLDLIHAAMHDLVGLSLLHSKADSRASQQLSGKENEGERGQQKRCHI